MGKKKDQVVEKEVGPEDSGDVENTEASTTVPTQWVFNGTDPEDGSVKVETTVPVKDPDTKALVKNLKAVLYYNFGEDLDDMVERFGEDVVYSQAKAQMKIRLQSLKRSRMRAGLDVGELREKFIPGIAMERTPQDMGKASEAYFDSLSPEEQDAMLARLQEKRSTK